MGKWIISKLVMSCVSGLLLFADHKQAIDASELTEADVVVYTANPGGIMAAIAAAREKASVILIEPSVHPGGIIARGGLCVTDIGKHETVGGLSKNFLNRVADYYRTEYGENSVQYRTTKVEGQIGASFEPKVAEATFKKMLAEYPNIKIVYGSVLDAVHKEGSVIRSITCRNAQGQLVAYQAKQFIDASYTGDLMAKAGIKYLVGTEGKSVFNESGAPDKSSAAIQAYNYRVTISEDPNNQVKVNKPEGYDPSAYEIRLKGILNDTTSPVFKGYWRLPNNKMDANIADFPGENWNYPEASYEERKEMERRHRINSLGYIYFLQNDPRVPERVRNETRRWGLAKDEFTDNGNFPSHIYVREGRRLAGAYIMVQKDLQESREKEDAIALGSYSMDSHATQVSVKPDGSKSYTGGGIWEPVEAYEIPYRSLTPVKNQCTNLLVPVCMSASHMAWTSLRMEPVFMMTGEAAGIAAAMALKSGAVQDIDVEKLRARLKAFGGIVNLLPQPVADFSWAPQQIKKDVPVTFTYVRRKNSTEPVKFYWDFDGDGKPDSQEANPTTTFGVEKFNLVSLVVEDASGKRSHPIAKKVKVGNARAQDIHIDSEDGQNVALKMVKKSNGQSPYWGNYYHTDGNSRKGQSYAAYDAPITKKGFYQVYVSSVPGSGRSKNTLVEIEHKGGTEKVYIDQGKGDPLFGMIYLGKYEFEPGKTARVTIRNNDHGRYILYDVARWIYVE